MHAWALIRGTILWLPTPSGVEALTADAQDKAHDALIDLNRRTVRHSFETSPLLAGSADLELCDVPATAARASILIGDEDQAIRLLALG